MQEFNRLRRLQDECPSARTIEELLLRAHKYPQVFRDFEFHMLTCTRCGKIVGRIRLFYEILERELTEQQDPKVVQFVKALEADVQP